MLSSQRQDVDAYLQVIAPREQTLRLSLDTPADTIHALCCKRI
jgi:hypothetical protein